jgi:cell division protein FtsI/penicillin-binding protein 2
MFTEGRRSKQEGIRGDRPDMEKKRITNYQLPIPHSQLPLPHSQLSTINSQLFNSVPRHLKLLQNRCFERFFAPDSTFHFFFLQSLPDGLVRC